MINEIILGRNILATKVVFLEYIKKMRIILQLCTI